MRSLSETGEVLAMHVLDSSEAGSRLSELLDEAAVGKSVGIRRTDGLIFRLVPVGGASPRPRYGSAKGLIEIAEDFEEPLEGFEIYQP